MLACWGHIRFQLLPGELPKDWGLGHGWHLLIRKKHSVDGWVFKKVSSYPWSDASCSEFQNIHCHQATECFETTINPWVRMTYHSRCTSSSQSCHHLLSPWLWWNSWWGFFGWGLKVENTNSSRSQQGWAKKVSRTAVGCPESCECPRTLLWHAGHGKSVKFFGDLSDLRWLGDHFLAEKSCITLWPNGQESSNDYSWHEWADKKVCWKLNFVFDSCSLASPEFLQSFCRTCPIDHWHSCLDYCAPVWNVAIWHGHGF